MFKLRVSFNSLRLALSLLGPISKACKERREMSDKSFREFECGQEKMLWLGIKTSLLVFKEAFVVES
jgi:hypothetical protein